MSKRVDSPKSIGNFAVWREAGKLGTTKFFEVQVGLHETEVEAHVHRDLLRSQGIAAWVEKRKPSRSEISQRIASTLPNTQGKP